MDQEHTSAKRRVSVRRAAPDALNKRLETARTEEAVVAARKAMAEQVEEARALIQARHNSELCEARNAALDDGIEQGKTLAMADYDNMLDESVNNRLCDNERDLPWPVGVIIAGEQHRILQALAEYLDDADIPGLTAKRFATRLGIIWFPAYLDAPSAVTFRNCEEPPKHKDYDQKGNQIELESGEAKLPGYSEHWKYYLRQLDDKGTD